MVKKLSLPFLFSVACSVAVAQDSKIVSKEKSSWTKAATRIASSAKEYTSSALKSGVDLVKKYPTLAAATGFAVVVGATYAVYNYVTSEPTSAE